MRKIHQFLWYFETCQCTEETSPYTGRLDVTADSHEGGAEFLHSESPTSFLTPGHQEQ